ncbi:hypothetical protein [Salipaludibacillus aurantiacus]|uniref:DUF4352 domain-containing protein n=1 Tax=Salipaludibacillus aurantiacus TaxID=1601833 RepID=A0A1H9Q864_9BACI|nr:hypothetical protein [Salipaludibacillus aurantiacus]SER56681.1 hypothetical protein SAMN05518684_10283 [Salipaludibacillus aurantiacus]
MKRLVGLVSLLSFPLVISGCQLTGNTGELAWGETAATENLEITPETIQIGTEENQIDKNEGLPQVTSTGQVALIELNIENTGGSPVEIDRDFYYHSFGILHNEEAMPGEFYISRMDLDAFPFDVYTGGLEEGEAVDTQLIIVTGRGKVQNLLFDSDGDLEDDYEVSWEIED